MLRHYTDFFDAWSCWGSCGVSLGGVDGAMWAER